MGSGSRRGARQSRVVSEGVVGIVGTGALGASIGMRARARGLRVLGYDAEPARSAEAQALGALDASVPLANLYESARTIVLALHLDQALGELERLRARPVGAELIVDIASVKRPIVAAARDLPAFVATHPMAGTERSGPAAARADLFEGRTWAYVPSGDERLDERARTFILALGGTPFAVDAAAHDRLVARTSHLPQLCATLLAAQCAQEDDAGALDALSGPAARELRRLARSPLRMWEPILRSNAANVAREARLLAAQLNAAADALARDDPASLRAAFERAGAG